MLSVVLLRRKAAAGQYAERIGRKLGRSTPEELAHVVEGFNEMIGLWLISSAMPWHDGYNRIRQTGQEQESDHA